VDLDLAAGSPMLNLDMVLFEQVLFNLLDNAAKYAPPGIRIQIKAWCEGERVVLWVMDEGDGIPPADLERIFARFHRAHGADRQRAGTGLGLAICRGFVEAMGGTIVAADRAGQPGAIMTITLPVPVDAPLPEDTVT
jgi:two-component system sensor histidine kinase KdpD